MRIAVITACSLVLYTGVVKDVRSADEVVGRFCTDTLRLQNGGVIYANIDSTSHAEKLKLENDKGKQITIAYNQLTKRAALTKDGETLSLKYPPDLDFILKREFGSEIKPKDPLDVSLDPPCIKKTFVKSHFDIPDGLPEEQSVLPAPVQSGSVEQREPRRRVAPPERQLAEYPPFEAFVAADFTCNSLVTITVRAPDEAAFRNQQVELQKLIGGLRAILGFECPKTTVTELIVVGVAEGREVYLGTASANEGWLLADLLPAGASEPIEQITRPLVPDGTPPGQVSGEGVNTTSAPVDPHAIATAGDPKGTPTNLRTPEASALIQASEEGDLEKVRDLLAEGADVNARRADGETALLAAARKGNAAIVQELIVHGADVSIRDRLGDTPLNVASDRNFQNVADILRAGPITTGMTMEQVISARGIPTKKEIIPPDMELWQYYPTGEVAFQNGKVSYFDMK